MRRPWRHWRVLALCGALFAFPLSALEVRQEAQRGLEDHQASLRYSHQTGTPRDSLALDGRVEWRAGFRDYNRDSRRLLEQLNLSGSRGLCAPLRLRWAAGHSLFNERRSLRETLASTLDAGLGWKGPLNVDVLAGWRQDRRQTGFDQGPRASLTAALRRQLADWELDTRGALQLERPGRRDNQQAQLGLAARWAGPDRQRDELVLDLRRRREDSFPDPLGEVLERRRSTQLRLDNRFRMGAAGVSRLAVDVAAWHDGQRRAPRAARDSVGSGRGGSLDRGLEVAVEPTGRRGAWEATLRAVWRRQAQEAEYTVGERDARTLSAISLNRLEGRLLWNPATDSLSARAAMELRRRDSEFSGPLRRDPDHMDQTRRELLLRGSRGWRPGARLGVEAGVVLGVERHLQASRSSSNYLGRTWRAGTDHRLARGPWRWTGGGRVVADYRLYDFDDPDEPRSWIQRRLSWTEAGRRDLGGAWRWQWAWEGSGRWMEEDGGNYDRTRGLQRISESAREWELGTLVEARRGGWMLRPGWNWLVRQDWRWSTGQVGGRERQGVRWLERQGPRLVLDGRTSRQGLRLEVAWEESRDRGSGDELRRRELRAQAEWSWRGK
jgi:hypothetical protein